MALQTEFSLTTRDFDRIRALVTRHIGIALPETKRHLVYNRLARRLRQLRLASFEPYYRLLETGDTDELQHFVSAITTHLTAFFRDTQHFDYLASTLLPALLRDKVQSRRLRLWSAGCSTGEEPYSLAMVLKETVPYTAGWDIKVLATDIDTQVLATARRGIYAATRVQVLSQERLRRWFRRGTGSKAGLVRVVPELQRAVTYRQLNLIQTWPMRGAFDVIFCRNVLIYFDAATQKRLLERFADRLATPGYLFVSPSESLFNATERFALIGPSIYRKRL